jgi:hypothetical protein
MPVSSAPRIIITPENVHLDPAVHQEFRDILESSIPKPVVGALKIAGHLGVSPPNSRAGTPITRQLATYYDVQKVLFPLNSVAARVPSSHGSLPDWKSQPLLWLEPEHIRAPKIQDHDKFALKFNQFSERVEALKDEDQITQQEQASLYSSFNNLALMAFKTPQEQRDGAGAGDVSSRKMIITYPTGLFLIRDKERMVTLKRSNLI